MIDKDKLFARSGQFPVFERVRIDELGDVAVKVLTVAEFDEMDAAVSSKKMGTRTALLRYCVMEENNGASSFNDGDIVKIEQLPRRLIEPIVDVAIRLNKMSNVDQDQLAKNSNGQSGDSSSV